MPMVTRCPACATLFRVAAHQLKVRQGRVRCGRCATVFDGFRDLATLPDAFAAEPAPTEGARASETSLQPISGSPARILAFATPEIPATPAVPSGFRFQSFSSAGDEALLKGSPPQADARREQDLVSTPPIGADARFLQQAQAARRRSLSGWTLGSALLVVTLAAQAGYFYRGELAAQYRPLRPFLSTLCRPLNCEIPLPQRPKLINIEASDVQGVDPTRPGVIELTATLRNHADYDVAFPALDLVLTNTRDHTLARRVFLPQEYLEPPRNAKAGLPAKAEMTVRLTLDTGELGAAGFRLDLLPAPDR